MERVSENSIEITITYFRILYIAAATISEDMPDKFQDNSLWNNRVKKGLYFHINANSTRLCHLNEKYTDP